MIGGRKFRTEEARQKYSKRLKIVGTFVLFLIALSVYFLYFLLQQDTFKLKTYSVSTDGVLERNEIEDFIKNELNSKIFYIFPKNSIFIPQKKYIEKALVSTYPRIAEATATRVGFSSLDIAISEKKPAALWCGDIVPSIAEKSNANENIRSDEQWGSCYVLDVNGFLYAKAPIFSGDIFPRYYGSLSKAEPIGQQFVDQDDFTRWQTLYTSLSKNDIHPQALLFVDEQDVEIYFSNGIKILVPRDKDTETIVENYTTLFESNVLTSNKEIDYVDFRFGNKIFIKHIDEEPVNLE